MNKQSTTSQADRQRAIKFRAWDTVNEEMIPLEFWISNSGSIVRVDDGKEMIEPSLEQEQFKIMQFTGLLDKSGKEIYEGDVVEYSFDNTERKRGVIRYQESSMRFVVYYGKMYEYHVINSFNEIVVIGNVHANSNLLQGT